jgi:penicillin-binding protein 1A
MAVTPMQMAVAYATFANGGHRIVPHVVTEVHDINGNLMLETSSPTVCDTCATELEPIDPATLPTRRRTGSAAEEPATLAELLAEMDTEEPGETTPVSTRAMAEGAPMGRAGPVAGPGNVPAQRVIDARIAYIMNSMLQDVVRRGTGLRARTLERTDIAGKTGTTNEAADTWFNGYNRDVVTTVWVGFPNHQPLGAREYGSNTPLPIWIDYMRAALAGHPQKTAPQPAGVVSMKIDPVSGQIASATNPDAIFEYFLSEYAPKASDPANLQRGKTDEPELKPVEIF